MNDLHREIARLRRWNTLLVAVTVASVAFGASQAGDDAPLKVEIVNGQKLPRTVTDATGKRHTVTVPYSPIEVMLNESVRRNIR